MSVRLWCGLFQELRDVIFGSVACLRTHRGQTTKARAQRSKKLRFILSDPLVKLKNVKGTKGCCHHLWCSLKPQFSIQAADASN